jgi:hypothetical protein
MITGEASLSNNTKASSRDKGTSLAWTQERFERTHSGPMIAGKESSSTQNTQAKASGEDTCPPPPPPSGHAPSRKPSLAQRLFKRGSTGSPTSIDICLKMGDCSPFPNKKADKKAVLSQEETDLLLLQLEDGVLGSSSPGRTGSEGAR